MLSGSTLKEYSIVLVLIYTDTDWSFQMRYYIFVYLKRLLSNILSNFEEKNLNVSIGNRISYPYVLDIGAEGHDNTFGVYQPPSIV